MAQSIVAVSADRRSSGKKSERRQECLPIRKVFVRPVLLFGLANLTDARKQHGIAIQTRRSLHRGRDITPPGPVSEHRGPVQLRHVSVNATAPILVSTLEVREPVSPYVSVSAGALTLEAMCPNSGANLEKQQAGRVLPRTNVFTMAPGDAPDSLSREDAEAMFPGLFGEWNNQTAQAAGDGLPFGVRHFDHEAAWRAVELLSDFLHGEGLLQLRNANQTLLSAFENLNSWTSRANLFRMAIVYFCGGTYFDAKTEAPSMGRPPEQEIQTQNSSAKASVSVDRPRRLLFPVLDALFGASGGTDTHTTDGNSFDGISAPSSSTTPRAPKGDVLLQEGDIGMCLDAEAIAPYGRECLQRPRRGKLQNAFFATYPRNPALLYVMQQGIDNVMTGFRGHTDDCADHAVLDTAGPGAFLDGLLRHDCFGKRSLPRCVHASSGSLPMPLKSADRAGGSERFFVMLHEPWASEHFGDVLAARGSESSGCDRTALEADLQTVDFGDWSDYGHRYSESAVAKLTDLLIEQHWPDAARSTQYLDLSPQGVLLGWDSEAHSADKFYAVHHFRGGEANWNPASCGSGSYNELYSSGNFYCNRLANADCKLACREQRPHFDGPPADTPGSSPASFLERADGGVFSRAKGWGEEATSNRNP